MKAKEKYTVRRDPFARGEYRRFSIPGWTGSCVWCGSQHQPRILYAYLWENDDQRYGSAVEQGQKYFCNLKCFDTYHGR